MDPTQIRDTKVPEPGRFAKMDLEAGLHVPEPGRFAKKDSEDESNAPEPGSFAKKNEEGEWDILLSEKVSAAEHLLGFLVEISF